MLALILTLAQYPPTPLVRIGETCPLGYYRASAYCIPSTRTTRYTIPRVGPACPLGTYRTGNYCTESRY
jgi:hypothetical protein